MRAATALLLLLAAPVAAADLKGADLKETVQTVLDETIAPAHALLAQAGQALPLAAARDCADTQAIVSAYHALYDRWEYLQFLSFGPVEQFNRGQRLHFWPDRKNVVARQTTQILKNGEIGKIEGPGAVFASVAIQGLPALETLLYPQAGIAAISLDAARCRMVQAIAVNLAGITAELAEGWTGAQGHGQAMMTAGSANSPYSDMTAAASRLYNALLGQIEAMLALKLERVLARNAAEARPDRGEAALSQRSLRNLKCNLRGLRDAFAPGGKGFAAALNQAGQRALAKKTLAAFEAVEQALNAAPEPLERTVGKAEGWKKLDAVRRQLKILRQILTREVGPVLGMQFGFNALDGDGG